MVSILSDYMMSFDISKTVSMASRIIFDLFQGIANSFCFCKTIEMATANPAAPLPTSLSN
jgi:hypothetical protein